MQNIHSYRNCTLLTYSSCLLLSQNLVAHCLTWCLSVSESEAWSCRCSVSLIKQVFCVLSPRSASAGDNHQLWGQQTQDRPWPKADGYPGSFTTHARCSHTKSRAPANTLHFIWESPLQLFSCMTALHQHACQLLPVEQWQEQGQEIGWFGERTVNTITFYRHEVARLHTHAISDSQSTVQTEDRWFEDFFHFFLVPTAQFAFGVFP